MGDLHVEHEDGMEFVGINQEMTDAALENCIQELNFQKKLEDNDGDLIAAIFSENEADRFFGTKINPVTIGELEAANRMLDVLSLMPDVTVEKFTEPSPFCRSATVSVSIYGSVAHFSGANFVAFRRVVQLADSFDVMQFDGYMRIAFGFNDLWLEHRELTAAELEEQNKKFGLYDEGDYDYD